MANIRMHPVSSSNIEAVGYDSGILRVAFVGGSAYNYDGVPKSLFDDFMSSGSLGSFFHSNIRGSFSFSKV